MDKSFPPQGISKRGGQAPRDSHQLLVKKDTEGSHGTRKGLALPRDLPCPRHNVSASRASPTARIPTTTAKRH